MLGKLPSLVEMLILVSLGFQTTHGAARDTRPWVGPPGVKIHHRLHKLERQLPILLKPRLNHITRCVKDWVASKRFYMMFGFVPINRPNFKSPGAWLNSENNVQLHLVQVSKAKLQKTKSDDLSGPHARTNHIALETENFNEVLTKLERNGVTWKPDQIVRVKAGGVTMRQLFLPDPDGHFLEICECSKLHDFVFGTKRKTGYFGTQRKTG